MADELIKENPYNARHLFYEEIQQLIETMRKTGPEDLKGKSLLQFLRRINWRLSMLRLAKKRSKRGSLYAYPKITVRIEVNSDRNRELPKI